MNNLKRFTICLTGHKWAKVPYPQSPEGEPTGTFFLRCRRCGAENHEAEAGRGGPGGWVAGSA